jgi:hypothetical protein
LLGARPFSPLPEKDRINSCIIVGQTKNKPGTFHMSATTLRPRRVIALLMISGMGLWPDAAFTAQAAIQHTGEPIRW